MVNDCNFRPHLKVTLCNHCWSFRVYQKQENPIWTLRHSKLNNTEWWSSILFIGGHQLSDLYLNLATLVLLYTSFTCNCFLISSIFSRSTWLSRSRSRFGHILISTQFLSKDFYGFQTKKCDFIKLLVDSKGKLKVWQSKLKQKCTSILHCGRKLENSCENFEAYEITRHELEWAKLPPVFATSLHPH